jgi:hypothetical protein
VNLRSAAAIERFLADAGWADAARRPLGADWSNRHYQRLRRGNGGTAILMDSGDDAPVGPFLAVGAWLRSVGLHAPEVFASDETSRLALLEDLGDDLLARVVERGGDEAALYRLALDAILHFQDATPPTFLPVMDEAGLLALLDVYLDFASRRRPRTSGPRSRRRGASCCRSRAPERTCSSTATTTPKTCSGCRPRAASGAWACSTSRTPFLGPAAYDVVSLVQTRDATSRQRWRAWSSTPTWRLAPAWIASDWSWHWPCWERSGPCVSWAWSGGSRRRAAASSRPA